MNFEAIGGRRYVLTWAVGIGASVMQWCGKLDPSGTAWAGVIVATVAAYITNNTWQKKVEAEK